MSSRLTLMYILGLVSGSLLPSLRLRASPRGLIRGGEAQSNACCFPPSLNVMLIDQSPNLLSTHRSSQSVLVMHMNLPEAIH